jgi:DNA-binding MarR family transcriptional regulator
METTALDLYDAAFLAGGADRVVDAAVVVLVETKRVSVGDEGRLTATDPVRRHPVEGAVLDAIGTRGTRTVGYVRLRAADDHRIAQLVDRLEREGLVTRGARFRGLRRVPATVPTAAGKQALKRLRGDPPAWRTGNAALVALGGTSQLPDADLRTGVFESDRPVRGRNGAYRGPRLASRQDLAARGGMFAGGAYGAGDYGAGYAGTGDFGGGCDAGGGGSC